MRFTINPDAGIIISLEAISRKRAIVSYDAAGTITEAEVEEATELSAELRRVLLDWLKSHFPELIDEQ